MGIFDDKALVIHLSLDIDSQSSSHAMSLTFNVIGSIMKLLHLYPEQSIGEQEI
jgi:hypothetical protein